MTTFPLMDVDECRRLFSSRPVARLATIGSAGPHLVPIVFAVEGDAIVTAIDHKPKRRTRLQRLVNIERNRRVSVLADHYEHDWERLWWVRADGVATIIDAGPRHRAAIDLLAEKYSHYRDQRPEGPVVTIGVERWSGWRARPAQ